MRLPAPPSTTTPSTSTAQPLPPATPPQLPPLIRQPRQLAPSRKTLGATIAATAETATAGETVIATIVTVENRNDRGGRTRAPSRLRPRPPLRVEDAPANQTPELDAIAEPIVLPGESLSKYRKGGETPAASASKPAEVNVIIPAAPEFTIPAGWDGGATLPGESLSRHRRSENRDDSRSVRRQDTRESYRTIRASRSVVQRPRPCASEAIEEQPEVLPRTETISSADSSETTTPPAPRIRPSKPQPPTASTRPLPANSARAHPYGSPEARSRSDPRSQHDPQHYSNPRRAGRATQPRAGRRYPRKFDWQTPTDPAPLIAADRFARGHHSSRCR